MSFIRNLENAEATFHVAVTETVEDRIGDTTEVTDWVELTTIPVRFESETAIQAQENSRFVAEAPGVFVDPDRIDESLADADARLSTDDWPFLSVEDRVEVNGEEYRVTVVDAHAFDDIDDPDVIALELERTD